ncbi:MAG: Crp/Fnr family transcriptional regulator [Methylococcales bacterium]
MLTPLHKDFVKKIHLFDNLTEAQLSSIWDHAHLHKLKKEQSLFSQGDGVTSFYLVFSGLVKLFRISADGQEKVIEVVNSGETFAEALMFLEQPHFPVSGSALNEAEVIAFDARQFLQMLNKSPETCLVLLGKMSQRIRGLVHEIDHLSVQTGRNRLAAYLLEEAGDRDKLHLKMPKSVLASRLSIKPETFSRIIKQLRNSDTIEVDGSDITILDREQMEDFAMV